MVLVHLGEHWRQFGDLMPERVGIVSVEVVATASALGRLAHDDLAKLFRRDQSTDTTAMTGLPSPLLPRWRNRRAALHRRGIRGGRPGRIGGVGIEPFLKSSDPLLQSAHQSQDGRLRLRRECIPNLLWKRRAIRHNDVVINSTLGGKNGP